MGALFFIGAWCPKAIKPTILFLLPNENVIFERTDPRKLPSSFAGRFFNAKTLEDLPKEIDPCGENGEFHTFVFASPNFNKHISISIGEKVERDGFLFTDILPAD